jgi:molybdate/tungstate transport system substrate-binding protein
MLAVILLAVVPDKPTVSVIYAASIARVMEGPIRSGFERSTGFGYEGEARGSKAIVQLIVAGLRSPDVFISADPSLYPGLRAFGRSALVIGYAPDARFAAELDAAAIGKRSLASVLRLPGLRVGRTDPQLDPKGARTLIALRALGIPAGGDAEVFPEEDLLARVESGQADCGFFYATETTVAGLRSIALPNGLGSRADIAATYAIVAMPHAPHPSAAKGFVAYVLTGYGRKALESAGITYLP